MHDNFFSVGITGGIGSGKSLVCKIFSVLRIPVYSSDDRAKWLMANDDFLKGQLKLHFGSQAFDQHNELNRSYLANVVFKKEKERQLLNELVHPYVAKDYLQWQLQQTKSPYTLKEAALIFETGSDKLLNVVINISAPKALRLKRVLRRDPHRSQQQVKAIMNKQWTDAQREEKADYVINNDEEHLLIPKVLEVHRQLSRSALKFLA